MRLDQSKILITGGSLGIGKATAKLLAECGAEVAITGRDAARLESAASETGATPIVADVGNHADIEKTYADFLGRFGRLDCLVNNAGIGVFPLLENVTMEDFESVFRVNVYGAALMAAAAVPVFKKQNYGNIINVGSTSGLKGHERGTVYSASKFALRGLSQVWQAELRKYNVRVIHLNPSEVATAFGNADREEREAPSNKLRSFEIAHAIKSVLEMDDRGFIPECSVFATNPW